MHESHAYAGCWLEERTLPEPSSDDLQHIRKLATDELITAFECTVVASETPGTLKDAELLARPHLQGDKPFRLALDVRRARVARIHPLPIPNQPVASVGAGILAGQPKCQLRPMRQAGLEWAMDESGQLGPGEHPARDEKVCHPEGVVGPIIQRP